MTENYQSTLPSADIVYCCDLEGQLHPIARTDLTFRPAVYGILLEHDQALLHAHPHTGLLQPPGGIVAPEQAAVKALRQLFRAATGVTPLVGDLLLVEEAFQLDEHDEAWHLSVMYYGLSRPSGGRAGLIDFENPARPEWVSVQDLQRKKVQLGYDAIQTAFDRLGASNR